MEKLNNLSGEQTELHSSKEQYDDFDEFNVSEAKRAIVEKQEELEQQTATESAEIIDRIGVLKEAKVSEGKFKIPAECYDEMTQEVNDSIKDGYFDRQKGRIRYEVERLEKIDGEIDQPIGEKLWSLFSDPDISIGIHGTVGEIGSDLWSERSPIFENGLGCAYGDTRRTVSFQDRGRVHAHGEISFLDLLTYDYPSRLRSKPLTIEKRIYHSIETEGGKRALTQEDIKVPATQYSVIVAIPKSINTADPILRGEEETLIINKPHGERITKKSRAIKGEFIVGIIPDSNPNSIIWNHDFDINQVKELGRQREFAVKNDYQQQVEKVDASKISSQPPSSQVAQKDSKQPGLANRIISRFKKRS